MVNGNNNFGIFLEPQDQHGVLRSTSSPSSLNLNTHLSHHYPLPSSNLEAKIYSVSSPLTQQLSVNISLKTSSNENKLNVSQVLYKLETGPITDRVQPDFSQRAPGYLSITKIHLSWPQAFSSWITQKLSALLCWYQILTLRSWPQGKSVPSVWLRLQFWNSGLGFPVITKVSTALTLTIFTFFSYPFSLSSNPSPTPSTPCTILHLYSSLGIFQSSHLIHTFLPLPRHRFGQIS